MGRGVGEAPAGCPGVTHQEYRRLRFRAYSPFNLTATGNQLSLRSLISDQRITI